MLVSKNQLTTFCTNNQKNTTKIASEELEERLDVDFYRRMNSN